MMMTFLSQIPCPIPRKTLIVLWFHFLGSPDKVEKGSDNYYHWTYRCCSRRTRAAQNVPKSTGQVDGADGEEGPRVGIVGRDGENRKESKEKGQTVSINQLPNI